MTSPVEAVVNGLHPRAARELGQLLALAVRGASYQVHPDVQAFVLELRAWSMGSAQREAPQVFRNTPGVPVLALSTGDRTPCAHDVIGISEAARRMGRSEGLLRRHARRGEYGARKSASGAWLLDAAAVDGRAGTGRGSVAS